MQVILREDVPDLGMIGEIVNVKPGYARNYLLPRGLAVQADKRNLAQLEHAKREIEAKRLKERGSVQAMADALAKLSLETERRAGRRGKLFGSVTNLDIKKLLDEKGFDLDRRRIVITDAIKEIGEHTFTIRVGQDVTTDIKVVVKPLGGELVDESVEGDDEPVVAAPIMVSADDGAEQAEGESADEGASAESSKPDKN